MSGTVGPVEERPVRLEVNGRVLHRWTASPGLADALAAGRLLAEGFIRGREDLLELTVEEREDGVLARARVPESAAATAFHAQSPGAPARQGEPGAATMPLHPSAERPRAPLPPLDAFGALFRELFASAELHQRTGGLHSAALSDGVRLVRQVEEVGRHNAVDKLIGLAVLAGEDLSRLGLILSSRVSGAIALKAARAGVAWIASRSVPTTMAVAVAETSGLPIVARAAGKDPYVYAAPEPRERERVESDSRGDARGRGDEASGGEA